MSRRNELYQEIAERYRRQHREDTRARRRFWLRVIVLCWVWATLGMFLGAWAFHTTDVQLGGILLSAGQLVTLVGVLGTLGWALHASEERGWR